MVKTVLFTKVFSSFFLLNSFFYCKMISKVLIIRFFKFIRSKHVVIEHYIWVLNDDAITNKMFEQEGPGYCESDTSLICK